MLYFQRRFCCSKIIAKKFIIYLVCLFLVSFEEHYKQKDSFGFVYTQSPTNLARIKEVHVNKTLYPVAGLTQADCVEDQRPGSAVCLSQVVK